MSYEKIMDTLIYGDKLQNHFDFDEIDNNTLKIFSDDPDNKFRFTVTSNENDIDELVNTLTEVYNDRNDQIHEDLSEEERQQYMK